MPSEDPRDGGPVLEDVNTPPTRPSPTGDALDSELSGLDAL